MFNIIKTYYGLKTLRSATRTAAEVEFGPRLFKWNNPVYLFSNENISGYLNGIDDIRGGRVLSVGASGDHAFEAMLAGAKTVDMFDINYMQRHVLELKNKMITYLPHADFVEYFFDHDNAMNPQIIRPIYRKFSPALRVFMQALQRKEGVEKICHSMMWHDADMSPIRYIADASAYDELQRMLKYSPRLNFRQTDLLHVPAVFNEKYDVILLSNIFTYYAPGRTHVTQLKTFYNNILSPLAKFNLGNQGTICFNYLWTSLSYNQWKNNFMRLCVNRAMIESLTISPHHSFKLAEIPSALKPMFNDGAFIMHQHAR